jgi:HAMP domain-containing protein
MLIWLCAAFLVVAILGSLAVAATRGWRLWKTVGATTSRLGNAVEHVSKTAAAAERNATSLTENTERLSRALERLQESLAELAVLRGATDDVTSALRAVRAFVPTK